MGGWRGSRQAPVNTPEFHRRRQKAVVFVGMMLFQLVLFFLQLWLFVMVLENMLAGKTAMAVPAAVLSFVVLGINVWMLQGVRLLNRGS